MRRDARALRAERLFHDLDDDLLPFFEQVFDLRRRWRALARPALRLGRGLRRGRRRR
jgi:hypothetical protein